MSGADNNIRSTEPACDGQLFAERSKAASEIGAAIVHQLSEPLTALLLYVSELQMNSDRLPIDQNDSRPLKDIVDGAVQEAERACSFIRRLGDICTAPLSDQSAVRHAREVIAWWSRATTASRPVEDAGEAGNSSYRLLTRREREVLHLVGEGLTSKEGALQLKIGPRTFESHRARIMKKFKARNVADLVRMSLQIEAGRKSQNAEPTHDVEAFSSR